MLNLLLLESTLVSEVVKELNCYTYGDDGDSDDDEGDA